jgi:P2X purinoceptor 4
MYERVWDEADYVVPPAENGAFFVMTNVVLTPNQTRSVCPEDPAEVKKSVCNTSDDCEPEKVISLVKGHGTQTGVCVPSDRKKGIRVSNSVQYMTYRVWEEEEAITSQPEAPNLLLVTR